VQLADTDIFALQFQGHTKSRSVVEYHDYRYRRVKVNAAIATRFWKKAELHLNIWRMFSGIVVLLFNSITDKCFYGFEI